MMKRIFKFSSTQRFLEFNLLSFYCGASPVCTEPLSFNFLTPPHVLMVRHGVKVLALVALRLDGSQLKLGKSCEKRVIFQ